MDQRALFSFVVVLGVGFFVGSGTVSGQDYFPVQLGNTWTYSNDTFAGNVVNSVVAIDESDIVSFARRRPDNIIFLEVTGPRVDIELPDEGFVTFYAFDEESFLHHDINDCENDRMIEVAPRLETVDTPAGVFNNCVRLDYGPGICADAGIGTEWFAPGVGLVKWVETSFVGPVTYVLQSFENTNGTSFIRGEINQDGDTDLADPIFALIYLFAGGEEPACLASVDVNDDNALDLSDPVSLLTYLFLGGLPPASPFPVCGTDPSPTEEIGCESFSSCTALTDE